jgi:hypothetical protein
MEPRVMYHLRHLEDLSNVYYFFVPWDHYPAEFQSWIDDASKKGMKFIGTQYYADYSTRRVPYFTEEKPKKTYLCYSGKSRAERTFLVGMLSYYDLLKHGYVTYFGEHYTDTNFTPEKTEDVFNSWILEPDVRSKLREGISKLQLPLTLEYSYFDMTASHNMNYCGDYYKAVDFVVVPETIHWNFFISEKTPKCIDLDKKFIVYGAPHFVKRLKEYYLKKFNKDISPLVDWCDTSYDDVLDTQQRAMMIIDIIKNNIKE